MRNQRGGKECSYITDPDSGHTIDHTHFAPSPSSTITEGINEIVQEKKK